MKLEKELQRKSKANRKKEIIKIWSEISKIEYICIIGYILWNYLKLIKLKNTLARQWLNKKTENKIPMSRMRYY